MWVSGTKICNCFDLRQIRLSSPLEFLYYGGFRWRRSSVLILEIWCLKQHWSSRLPVVLVVCGGTRSVARELGGLGSSSDWASVLLWLWTPCSPVPSPWASTDLLLVSMDFTHCGHLIYGIEHYAAFCAVFFCMTNVFRVYLWCGMNLYFAPFNGWISLCVATHFVCPSVGGYLDY